MGFGWYGRWERDGARFRRELKRIDLMDSERKGQSEEIGGHGLGISSGNDAMLITALLRGGRIFLGEAALK